MVLYLKYGILFILFFSKILQKITEKTVVGINVLFLDVI